MVQEGGALAPTQELFSLADCLDTQQQVVSTAEFDQPVRALSDAAEKVGKAWSGSWIGYHACVYYAGLTEPPVGAHFSKEWGLMGRYGITETTGDWREFRFDDVTQAIYDQAGNPDLSSQEELAEVARDMFDEAKARTLSILSAIGHDHPNDKFAADLQTKVEEKQVITADDFIKALSPSGQVISRDSVAIGEGFRCPPHVSVLARVYAIQYPFDACKELSKYIRQIASHLEHIERRTEHSMRIGTNVFIGHGGSPIWKDLKDFIQDRLHLPWDEFNRVPVAGITNVARLSEMLDEAAVAFLLMTAEDEQADGRQHARQNVIHEAGLFQGRLGFQRAIVLIEEGCEEFSNIQGLGQIRFPRGNISAVFEEV